MSVGFNHIITFDRKGKVIDYQQSYNDNYAKTIRCFLPQNINNRNCYRAHLAVRINNTFPVMIVKVVGNKSETDLNCYNFDLSDVYEQYKVFNKIGLMQVILTEDNDDLIFKSESFRA